MICVLDTQHAYEATFLESPRLPMIGKASRSVSIIEVIEIFDSIVTLELRLASWCLGKSEGAGNI